MKIDSGILSSLSAHYGVTSVSVGEFFLSHNSVMTIAFEGFSATLLNVKAHIESALRGDLAPENKGTKWPKVTLGCLGEGLNLTMAQVRKLRAICTKFTGRASALLEEEKRVPVLELEIVVFNCRSLERRLLCIPLRLSGAVRVDDDPPAKHMRRVWNIMAQFNKSRLVKYHPKLNPNGRTIRYYRKKHVEATLIADVTFSKNMNDVIADFQRAVDQGLPGCYVWFKPRSWHLSLRALMPK